MIKSKRTASIVALATAIAVPAEGLRHYAYYDPPGILTVCRGSTNNVIKGRYYTLAECDARLSDEMREAVAIVERCHPGLPEPVVASFADAVFNGGPKIACDRTNSTAARMLDAGNIYGACMQHPRWNKSKVAGVFVALPGLTKRTNQRMELCLSGVPPTPITEPGV